MLKSIAERWKFMATEQKVSVVVLSVCGVFALVLSVMHLRLTISGPFMAKKSEMTQAKKIIGLSTEEEIAKQQRLDTDGDSLSNWDEENVYHTNPNLRDSCGDGTPDNVRVALGKDLSCAAKSAAGDIDYSGLRGSDAMGATTMQSSADMLDVFASSSQGTASTEQMLQRDPTVIREALKGKVQQDKLDQLTDAQLLEYYDLALEEQSRLEAGESGSTTTTQP